MCPDRAADSETRNENICRYMYKQETNSILYIICSRSHCHGLEQLKFVHSRRKSRVSVEGNISRN